jgi:hypothetical protein
MLWTHVGKEESIPRDSACAPQLPVFVSDPTASPDTLARYKALGPVLKGERSLRQQSQHKPRQNSLSLRDVW